MAEANGYGNSPTMSKTVPNGSKWSKTINNDPRQSNMVKYGPRLSLMVLNDEKWSKSVKMVPKCSIWSYMVFNVPKWSLIVKQIDHKFNWMAFITKLNLVLVWSKIVQILTKNHPNGSRKTRSPGLVWISSPSRFKSQTANSKAISEWCYIKRNQEDDKTRRTFI